MAPKVELMKFVVMDALRDAGYVVEPVGTRQLRITLGDKAAQIIMGAEYCEIYELYHDRVGCRIDKNPTGRHDLNCWNKVPLLYRDPDMISKLLDSVGSIPYTKYRDGWDVDDSINQCVSPEGI